MKKLAAVKTDVIIRNLTARLSNRIVKIKIIMVCKPVGMNSVNVKEAIVNKKQNKMTFIRLKFEKLFFP
jgi:hypothetical protein